VTSLATSALLVVLAALAPVSEVRGAIPLAYVIAQDGNTKWLLVTLATVFNSLIPFIALEALQVFEDMLLRSTSGVLGSVKQLYSRLVSRARGKGGKYLRRWGYLGLAVFVAIPLPVTGAWTASLIAHVFGLSKLRASLAIVIGVVVASLIVVLAMEGVLTIISLL
jgi:uncharacterized membrane protein